MGEIAFGIGSGLIVGYVVYNGVKSYKKHRNYQEFKDEEKSINELMDILKKERDYYYSKETSLNIHERKRVIKYSKNLLKESIIISDKAKLINLIRYLENPSKYIQERNSRIQRNIDYQNSKIKKEIDYLFK